MYCNTYEYFNQIKLLKIDTYWKYVNVNRYNVINHNFKKTKFYEIRCKLTQHINDINNIL